MAINNLKAKAIKTALLTMLITTIDTPATIAAGRTANSIANTVLSGSGVPAKSLGINGDFYIDIKTMNMYGPKKSNNWLGLYIALGIVWGCSFIFIKLGLEFLTPVGVAFGRVSLGALTLVF